MHDLAWTYSLILLSASFCVLMVLLLHSDQGNATDIHTHLGCTRDNTLSLEMWQTVVTNFTLLSGNTWTTYNKEKVHNKNIHNEGNTAKLSEFWTNASLKNWKCVSAGKNSNKYYDPLTVCVQLSTTTMTVLRPGLPSSSNVLWYLPTFHSPSRGIPLFDYFNPLWIERAGYYWYLSCLHTHNMQNGVEQKPECFEVQKSYNATMHGLKCRLAYRFEFHSAQAIDSTS